MLTEAQIQEKIAANTDIQKYIIDSLGYEYSGNEIFERERTYLNGITVDFKIKKQNEIIALVECKQENIGVTDYVRGIGQLLQYEYFKEEKIGSESYSDKYKTVYLFPSGIIKNPNFNIGRFKYPQTSCLMEFNPNSNIVREISTKELEDFYKNEENKKVSITQYYFRDNRLYEDYIALQYLKLLKARYVSKINRKEIEVPLSRLESDNQNNWRNSFITLSVMGLVDKGNMLNKAGEMMAAKSYPEFVAEIYFSYMKEPVDLLMEQLEKNSDLTQTQIKQNIERKFNGKEIVRFTDSKNRYLSSFLSILRDDFQCLEFEKGKNNREVLYIPKNSNKQFMIDTISKNRYAYNFLHRYEDLVRNGEI